MSGIGLHLQQEVLFNNNHQETSIKILQNPTGASTGVSYQISVTIGGFQTLYSDTTEPGLETIDQLGLRIATLANSNTGIKAIYNDSTNEIVMEAIQKNTPFTVNSCKSNRSCPIIKITSSKYGSNC